LSQPGVHQPETLVGIEHENETPCKLPKRLSGVVGIPKLCAYRSAQLAQETPFGRLNGATIEADCCNAELLDTCGEGGKQC
jgi:hypothetical protein